MCVCVYVCVCMYVSVSVYVCMRACARACVSVCVFHSYGSAQLSMSNMAKRTRNKMTITQCGHVATALLRQRLQKYCKVPCKRPPPP